MHASTYKTCTLHQTVYLFLFGGMPNRITGHGSAADEATPSASNLKISQHRDGSDVRQMPGSSNATELFKKFRTTVSTKALPSSRRPPLHPPCRPRRRYRPYRLPLRPPLHPQAPPLP